MAAMAGAALACLRIILLTDIGCGRRGHAVAARRPAKPAEEPFEAPRSMAPRPVRVFGS